MPPTAEDVEAEVVKRITPRPEDRDRIKKVTRLILDKVNECIKKYDLGIEPMVVGSIAYDTWLPNPDIDIFITFPTETPLAQMEEVGLEIGEDVLKGEKRYAEHPYTHGVVEGLEVDLVPCYRIEKPDQRKTAVDRTPLHTKYILEHLKEEQRKEVRLLKRFMKGVGVYGAEAKIQGFSGYLTVLLILKYGTFKETLKSGSLWKAHHKIELIPQEKSFEEPLIVIDPIDAQRNVASALSMENFSIFITACNAYLKTPGLEFFYPKPPRTLTTEEISALMKDRNTFILGLVFEAPKVVDDILYPQLRKCKQAISMQCVQNGFFIYDSDFEVIGSDTLMLFEFEVHQLPEVMKHRGPPIWVKDVERFLEKWRSATDTYSEPYIEDDHWVVDIRRKFTNVNELVKELIGELSLGKNINESIKKGYTLLEKGKIIKEEYLEFLSKYLNKKLPWEN